MWMCIYVRIHPPYWLFAHIQEMALRGAALRGHTAVVEMLAKIQASEKETGKVQNCLQIL